MDRAVIHSRIGLPEATAVSYAAGAGHLTAPAGTVISTGYVAGRGVQLRAALPDRP